MHGCPSRKVVPVTHMAIVASCLVETYALGVAYLSPVLQIAGRDRRRPGLEDDSKVINGDEAGPCSAIRPGGCQQH